MCVGSKAVILAFSILWLAITFALLPAQGEKQIKVFVGYRARIRREINASHKFSDTALGIMIDVWGFGFSFLNRHGCLPSVRKALIPKTARNRVNQTLTLALGFVGEPQIVAQQEFWTITIGGRKVKKDIWGKALLSTGSFVGVGHTTCEARPTPRRG